MNENSYTYNGVTVEYSQAQKDLLLNDQKVISDLQAQVRNIQGLISTLESQIQTHMAAVQTNGSCYSLSGFGGSNSPRQQCIDQNNNAWSEKRGQQATAQSQIDNINNSQIPAAVKKLNDDLQTIQNDIKLQIQAQISNSNAQNAPAVVAGQNAQAIEALHNQAELDKLKQEQNIKIAAFVLFTILVVGIVVAVVRK